MKTSSAVQSTPSRADFEPQLGAVTSMQPRVTQLQVTKTRFTRLQSTTLAIVNGHIRSHRPHSEGPPATEGTLLDGNTYVTELESTTARHLATAPK